MTRYALKFCAGLLAAVIPACAPPPAMPSPPLAAPPPTQRIIAFASHGMPQTTCTEDSFIAAISILQPAYSPNDNPGHYEPPYRHVVEQFDPGKNSIMTTDLKEAFNNAPPWFRGHLCTLRGIYINPVGCSNAATYAQDNYQCRGAGNAVMQGAWGFRSFYQNAEDKGSTYISLAAGLWPEPVGNTPSHALALHQYEDKLLGQLVSWRAANLGPYVLNPAVPNDPWMTVLAAMAHEYGHVHWADTLLPNSPGGNNYNFSTLIRCPNGTGGFDFFQYWAYNNNTNRLLPKDRWRGFKGRETAGSAIIDHTNSPTIGYFEDPRNTRDQKSAAFVDLYNAQQPWPSYFGSWAADEDFVETYVLKVLTKAQSNLTSLPVTVLYSNGARSVVDIPADLALDKKSALQVKMGCISS